MIKIKDLSLPKVSQRNNHLLLPRSIRGCIIGKSGCGKTNLLMNLLLGRDLLDYDHLYIFGKSLHQPEYQFLIDSLKNGYDKEAIYECLHLKNLENLNISGKENKIKVDYFLDNSEILDPGLLDPNEKNLVVFDDIMLEKQNKIENYYTRGRHNNIDCFYISQNYTEIPGHTVRENANFFILFPQDPINLNNFYGHHCTDISKEDFKLLCNLSFAEPFSFVTIDLTSNDIVKKYRKQLDKGFSKQYIIVNNSQS